MPVSCMCLPHKWIHLETWISPDDNTANQINHILVEKRQGSGIMNVRSYRGTACDSNQDGDAKVQTEDA